MKWVITFKPPIKGLHTNIYSMIFIARYANHGVPYVCVYNIYIYIYIYIYIPHRSTESSLNLINDLFISLDNKATCYLVLLDLSSAFDTLNHEILTLRLNEIGIHGQVHSWFMSFFFLRYNKLTHPSIPSLSALMAFHKAPCLVLYFLIFIFYP